MRYSRVFVEAIGYELAPDVLTSEEVEERLAPAYEALRLRPGQLVSWTGIHERRMWEPGARMAPHAAVAGKAALEQAGIAASDLGMVVYGGVCRDQMEPATACEVAHLLGAPTEAQIFDLSNACLGVLHGMLHVANAIELGWIRAGLVVSCESSRQIIDSTIARLNETPTMEMLQKTLATMTGGSGAVGVVLTDGSFGHEGHRLLGATMRNDSKQHELCRWGPDTGIPSRMEHVMETDAVGVLKHGVVLGRQTFQAFCRELAWPIDAPDKVICHQVGSAHQRTILQTLEIPEERDFTTFAYLGNMGTVALPLTAAIAAERDFLEPSDRVGFLGIGSGLNCLMMGLEWS
jgi:3-oxoacyl-[acyl-carrier-protein] synthase-3